MFLFLEYDFLIIYKLGRFHFVADALFQMLDLIEQNGVSNQKMDATLFLLQSVWLQEISKYLITRKKLVHYNQIFFKN
jgi:hypothetical protein